jgi:hypothetical protein
VKFFNQLPILTGPTVLDLLACLSPTTPMLQLVSSRLLDLQLKYVLYKFMRELISGALQDLERCMRSRTKDSWPSSFSAVLSLCLCIEELQIIAVKAATNQIVVEQAPLSKEAVLQACQEIEDYTFRLVTEVFHGIYRTTTNESGKADRSFNPLKRRLASMDPVFGSSNPAEDMIHQICQVLGTSSEYPLFLYHFTGTIANQYIK